MMVLDQSYNSQSPQFGRELKPKEWQGYRHAIQEAKQALDIKHLGLITPIRSLPADSNTGIGSLSGARDFFTFVSHLGFDMVQLDPEGKTKLTDPSPYTGTVFSGNPLYINLKELAEEPAWAGLLSAKTLADIEAGNPNPNGDKVAYRYIFTAQDKALHEVYQTFQRKLRDVSSLSSEEAQILTDLKARFDAFVRQNRVWLEPDALYEVLSQEYGNDYWPNWKGAKAKLDKNLYNPADEAQAAEAEARKAELKKQYADVVGVYEFTQFILSEQKHAFKTFAGKLGIASMADRQVGFSDRDVWAYQKLFLPGWSMGVPPDYFSKTGQAWGFPVLDPEKLFKPDGSLGEGGLLLKRLFDKIFEENPGGVRIDHVIGLIDPWVYPAGERVTTAGARLYSAPEHPALGQYAFIDQSALNHQVDSAHEDRVLESAMTDAVVDRYARILDRIVLQAAREQGIALEDIICEDLGTLTTPVKQVLNRRGLSGIRVTQFVDPNNPNDIMRGRNVDARNWLTIGTHDNESLEEWSRRIHKNGTQLNAHLTQLVDDVAGPDPQVRDHVRQRIQQSPLGLVFAKFVELFSNRSRQVQVFFADWLGMDETYNRPGTFGDQNWSLRIPRNFKDAYFDAVRQGRGLNLPEVLLQAMQAKNIQNPDLAKKLAHYADILKQA